MLSIEFNGYTTPTYRLTTVTDFKNWSDQPKQMEMIGGLWFWNWLLSNVPMRVNLSVSGRMQHANMNHGKKLTHCRSCLLSCLYSSWSWLISDKPVNAGAEAVKTRTTLLSSQSVSLAAISTFKRMSFLLLPGLALKFYLYPFESVSLYLSGSPFE